MRDYPRSDTFKDSAMPFHWLRGVDEYWEGRNVIMPFENIRIIHLARLNECRYHIVFAWLIPIKYTDSFPALPRRIRIESYLPRESRGNLLPSLFDLLVSSVKRQGQRPKCTLKNATHVGRVGCPKYLLHKPLL